MNRVPLRERCRNRWRSLLPLLGIDTRFLTRKQGPCPMCEGKDRFRFDDKGGEGTFYCNGCGAGDGVRLVELRNGWDFTEAAKAIKAVLGDAPAEATRREKSPEQLFQIMGRVWAKGEPLTMRSTATRYLLSRVPTFGECADLRCVEDLRHGPSNRNWPALLAMVRAHDGTPINLHRTFLDAAGGKAPVDPVRMTMEGAMPDGCAVRLATHDDTLGIAEGIETALSATCLTGIPCWAALNEGRLSAWRPPAGVIRVVVFGDNDAGFAGQAAAYTLARRLRAKRIEAEVRLPDSVGQDWNDVLTARIHRKQAA